MTSADNAMLFRNAVKEIAWEHGYLATFMAKPFFEESGSSFHVHQSLWDGDRPTRSARPTTRGGETTAPSACE